jgi:hypothetical protein
MSGRATLDAAYLADQYEALRREALALSPEARRGRGLALFQTHGMVRWIDAISTLSCRQTRSTAELATVPDAGCPEIATVLANMVLVCMQETQA